MVTYAPKGMVKRATSTALENAALDSQGRCIVTDHGSFVLYNVYVPCSAGQSQLPLKMKFLSALRASMRKERILNHRPIILVGDLNIAFRKEDVYWKWRVLLVDDILKNAEDLRRELVEEKCEEKVEKKDASSWLITLADNWSMIQKCLETKQAVETKTTNPTTGQTFDKFRVAVTVEGNRRVLLGSPELSAEACLRNYDFQERSYRDDDLDEDIVFLKANTVEVGILGELMTKVIGQTYGESILKEVAEKYAVKNTASPTYKWMKAVQEEDGMVDAFHHFYPEAEARFTCWNQSKNCRYRNEGARIDYTLIDRSLLKFLRKGKGPVTLDNPNFLSEEAALLAATAGGKFVPASFEGGGLNEASQQVLDTQFQEPQTGHVYTPPTFSDHIGVSLLLDDSIRTQSTFENVTFDTATRKTQPHKQQKTIASLFSAQRSDSSGKDSEKVPSRKPRVSIKPARKPARNSILYHFQKK